MANNSGAAYGGLDDLGNALAGGGEALTAVPSAFGRLTNISPVNRIAQNSQRKPKSICIWVTTQCTNEILGAFAPTQV